MTTEREEFEKMIRDATDGRLNEINEEYREEFKPINVIWSWHQQSLERAKQLSYQEAVEKVVKIIDEDIGHWHQTASMDVSYHDALVSIRHQLSILKGEK